ncbi:hypothetical protein, partial [Desulfovibrio desulfuricans]|uniref:hypothetical protein n=1 Tax=Desulfovibrio desulfuricans TaxID=876 RepID=UPI002B1F6196
MTKFINVFALSVLVKLQEAGIPASCMPARVGLVVPIIFDGLKYSYHNWYPANIVVHLSSLRLTAPDASFFVKRKET